MQYDKLSLHKDFPLRRQGTDGPQTSLSAQYIKACTILRVDSASSTITLYGNKIYAYPYQKINDKLMKNCYIIHDFMAGVLVAHITLSCLKNAFCWLSMHDSWPCELQCISSKVQLSHWKKTLAAFPIL